jgi:glycerol-3-phosphate acyltransferase PlsY
MITIIILIVIAYLCGSLSSAIIVCKLLNLPDPRIEGSGNPGTANVLRIGGKKAAALVLLGDVLKGFIPVIVARIFNIEGIALGSIALAAVIGHIYPIFFRFKGGKGVATFLGTTFALSASVGIAFVLTWFIIALIFHYASLASLLSSALSIIYILVLGKFAYLIPLLAVVALIIWKHTANIQRLLAGTETKISFKIKK